MGAHTMDFPPCLSKKSKLQGSPELLAVDFSPCLWRKSLFECCLRSAFPPACRGKGHLMDLVRACDGLLPSACRGKGRIMDLVCACDGLSPCLSRKRPSHGLGVRSRWPLSPVCRRKTRFRAPRHPPERPRKVPKSGPGAPEPKKHHFGLDLLLKQCLFEQGRKY